jgi:hypothetical protein
MHLEAARMPPAKEALSVRQRRPRRHRDDARSRYRRAGSSFFGIALNAIKN